ncbi:MAG: ComF family protein [Candidatus Omnitrophica bacterium]|nr:ComF family protein [Candidatus Omnitrophota bacterium]
MLTDLFVGVRSLLSPARCVGCQLPWSEEGSSPLCPACLKALPRCRFPWCQKFGPPLDQAVSVFHYEGAAKELIASLKYSGRTSLLPFLGQTLTETVLERLGPDPADAVLPVPLHPTRLRERTFNQAHLLAKELADNLDLPCWTHALVRRRPTLPQTQLPREARKTNVEKAFSLGPDPLIRSARLLLVDDVFTTGSTAASCAKLLKQAGAASVAVAALAHG